MCCKSAVPMCELNESGCTACNRLLPAYPAFRALSSSLCLKSKQRLVISSVLCTWRLTASMVNDADGVIHVKSKVKIVNYAVNRQSLVTVTPFFTIVIYGAIFEWRRMCTTLASIQLHTAAPVQIYLLSTSWSLRHRLEHVDAHLLCWDSLREHSIPDTLSKSTTRR